MRLNKILFYFSLSVSGVCLLVSVYLTFCVKGEVALFISNVLLNVFAGAIIMIFTTTIDYFLQRRRILTALMRDVLKYRNMFSKIDYIKVDNEKKYTKEEVENIKKVINTYINIADTSFEETWQLYDELYFLGSNKKKYALYTKAFQYIYDLLNKLRIAKFQFNEITDIKINYSDIKKLQKIVFCYEEQEINKEFQFTNDRLFIRKGGMNVDNNIQWVSINIVEEYLTNVFNEIGQMAYFNKKYNGLENK